MATFNELAQTESNPHWKSIYGIIARREDTPTGTEDSPVEITLDASELTEIQREMHRNVQEAILQDQETQTASEMKRSLILDTEERMQKFLQNRKAAAEIEKTKGIVQDGYMNPVSGIGTMIDPGMHTESFIPVSITPTEATSYYASGGIPARIINKKSGCLLLNGLHFECDSFTPEDLQELEEYAEKCGFIEAYRDGNTQALIFGGSLVYPVLKGDNPLTFQKGIRDTLSSLPEERNFIKHWVVADRWNCVFVPDYNITANDYLYARSLFIPLGGIRLNTGRAAMVRPQKLPFWAAIKQMGWSTSDFEGWIKDYESYEIMKMSLPIMAQQMSLMYHSFPADGMIIENGPDYARQFFKQNEAEMRDWSMLNPKAINSVGEIKILERTYSGFQQLISESRLALCSSAGVPESILFAEKATGLASDNTEDVTLKQSEMIRLLFNNVAPSYRNCIEILVASCFGKNSEQFRHAKEVRIAPDTGVVLSDQDKAQLGQAFTGILGGLAGVGLPIESAVKIAHKFVPSAEIDEETMNQIGAGEAEGMDKDIWEQVNGGRTMQNNNYNNPMEA